MKEGLCQASGAADTGAQWRNTTAVPRESPHRVPAARSTGVPRGNIAVSAGVRMPSSCAHVRSVDRAVKRGRERTQTICAGVTCVGLGLTCPPPPLQVAVMRCSADIWAPWGAGFSHRQLCLQPALQAPTHCKDSKVLSHDGACCWMGESRRAAQNGSAASPPPNVGRKRSGAGHNFGNFSLICLECFPGSFGTFVKFFDFFLIFQDILNFFLEFQKFRKEIRKKIPKIQKRPPPTPQLSAGKGVGGGVTVLKMIATSR